MYWVLSNVLDQCGKQKAERSGEQSRESMTVSEEGAGRWIKAGSQGRAERRAKLRASKEQDGYGSRSWEQVGKENDAVVSSVKTFYLFSRQPFFLKLFPISSEEIVLSTSLDAALICTINCS